MLTVGSPAPVITLPDQYGISQVLSQKRGKWVVLYFYPQDDTPGCTTEACGIRDREKEFAEKGVTVFGVSIDSVESHKKFAEKYHLPFTLLSDEGKEAVEAYGVWRDKNGSMGTARTTFLIDPEGVIRKIYEAVTPATHADEILRDLEELKGA